MPNAMRGVSFNPDAELRAWLDEFFESKLGGWFLPTIENLVERWEGVVNNKGEYIID